MADVELVADLEEALALPRNSRGSCRVCDHLDRMSEPTRIAVQEALSGNLGSRQLEAILNKHGYPVGASTILRHRKGHTS